MLQSFDCKNELIGVGLKQVMNRKGIIFLLVGVLLGIGGGKWYTMYGNDSKNKVEKNIINKKNEPRIPAQVLEILHYVETFHEPKKGYLGGTVYQNYDKRLPVLTARGDTIVYRKWNVYSNHVISDQALLITGNDHSAWYTDKVCKKINRIK